jgi:hypothetical protein
LEAVFDDTPVAIAGELAANTSYTIASYQGRCHSIGRREEWYFIAPYIIYYSDEAENKSAQKSESAAGRQRPYRVGEKILPVVEQVENFGTEDTADGSGYRHFADSVVGKISRS